MTEAQQFVEGLQTGKLPQCDRCGHYTLVRSFISGQLICPDCEHKLAITPPRKQPYVKVRTWGEDGIPDATLHIMLGSIILIRGQFTGDTQPPAVLVEGNNVFQIHPDDYPALLAAFEAWHAA